MLTTQSIKVRRNPPATHRLILSDMAVACILLAAVIPDFGLRLGVIVMALLLGYVAFRPRDVTAQTAELIHYDPDHMFITDEAGMVIFSSPMAVARFGDCNNRKLHDVFENLLADPVALLERMKHHVAQDYSCKEHIFTRRAHFRLSVAKIDDDRLLWRLDELGGVDALQGEGVPFPLFTAASDGVICHQNKALRDLHGKQATSLRDLFDELPLIDGRTTQMKTISGRVSVVTAEVKGHAGWRDIIVVPSQQMGHVPMVIEAGWDAIEDLPVPLLKITPDGVVLASNREARQLLHLVDPARPFLSDLLDGLGRPISDWVREAAQNRGSQDSQFLQGRGDNCDTFVQVTLNAAGDTDDRHLIAVLNDVTELKTLEAQFVQSQKMQAIGQLAGGVAHDFNNLLTAISGHCDLLLLRHDEGDQNYADLIQIHQNANRAASLVGQLLAFSRKQNLQPEILDLRDTLSELTHLLNRLVGERVTLSLHHDPALARIKADKRQLEQVLMNLVVNARDAMQGAGEIRVETENLVLSEPMTKDRAVVPPGEYVVVKVIDEGHGITPDKLHKIFEPFYTTKRMGEGTGLGLSTAYGIMKQSGGYIFADSDVSTGTVFSLFFPSFALPITVPIVPKRPPVGALTQPAEGIVLLVEDEAPVRAFASRALRLRGYTVLEADCGEAALALLDDPDLHVDLFVTDVIMPGIDGPTWVRRALQNRKDTKTVFVSGYAEDAFGDGQSHIPNSVFLPKPFSLNALTQTVQLQLADASQPV